MKTKLALTLLLPVILSGLLACSPGAPKELSVDITSSDKEVTLAAGDTLTVTLDSNPTTGYSWTENANISDRIIAQQIDHKYQPPGTSALGAGGKEIWTFKALKAGTSTISMEYRRPFETGVAPAKTFTLTLAVK